MSKKAITIRVDAALLAAVRERAVDENRTLTNYIETVLKQATAPPKSAEQLAGIVSPGASALASVPILLSGASPDEATPLGSAGPAGEA